MRLVGFINRSRDFPAPLVSVYGDVGRYFAFFPSGERAALAGVDSDADIVGRESFVGPGACPALAPGSAAYALSPGRVLGGTRSELQRQLRDLLASKNSTLGANDRERIAEFVDASDFGMDAEQVKDSLSNHRSITASIQSRRLRRHSKSAYTLLVQSRSDPSRVRTLYRKLIPHGKKLAEVRIPDPVLRILEDRAMHCA